MRGSAMGRGSGARAWTAVTVAALTVAVALVAAPGAGAAPRARDDAPASFRINCDRPNTGITPGLFANLNNEIPDPIVSDSDFQVVDTDPAISGRPTHVDLLMPFPAMSFPPNSFGVTYGTFYVKTLDITIPIPAGLDPTTATPVERPDRNYVTATRSGSNIVVHVQSPVSGSRIRIDTEVASPVAEVETAAGVWVPVAMPTIGLDPTVTAAPGTTITWRPPTSSNLVVKWIRDFGLLIGAINWNDLPMPCAPVDPTVGVATTTVARPALSVSTRADETGVVAGSPIHLHVTTTNTGDLPLTGVTVADARAPGCAGTPGTLAVGARITYDCTLATTVADVPSVSNTATADSNETAPVTSTAVQVTVATAASTGVSGTVTETGSGNRLAGTWLAVLRQSDFTIAAGAVADGNGDFRANVPVGDYFVYGLDPSGRHAAGFFGSPARVAVVAGAMTDADPALAPTRGAVAGTVTEQGSTTPVAGAWVLALDGRTGAPETMATAGADGRFDLPDLGAGNHFVAFVDPSGAHTPEFLGDAPSPAGAVKAVVSGGGRTTANGTPPAQARAGTGSSLSGRVTEAGTDLPLAGVSVIAMRASDYGFVRATTTDARGDYTLALPAGGYKLVFLDGAGRHHQEWYDDQPYTGIASARTATAPGTADAALDRNTGMLAGTLTDDPSGAPLPGAWAVAIGPNGIAGGAVTSAAGTYSITGLPAGTYRATFLDPVGGGGQEYWNDATSYAGAEPITVAGAATTTIDAALRRP